MLLKNVYEMYFYHNLTENEVAKTLFENAINMALQFIKLLYFLPSLIIATFGAEDPVYMCNENDTPASGIYCKGGEGSLLEAMLIKFPLFNDSKTFVDSPLKNNPEDILNSWKTASKSSKSEVQQFYNDHFTMPFTDSDPSVELDDCNLPDWTENPKFIDSISDYKYKTWAKKLNTIWKSLCRKMKDSVRLNPNRTSLINVPNNFVVPGGRFREYYYWDTYWIVKGLIASEMYQTVEGMLHNFATMVYRYGFVPNGGRIYYLRRSQPPLLIPMVYDLYMATGNLSFLTNTIGPNLPRLIDLLIKEFEFWQTNRAVQVIGQDGNMIKVYRYHAASNTPRPESYDKDVKTASSTPDEKKPLMYQNLASAAESGWDFSSRWFADGFHMNTIEITEIIPVELNAYLCRNAKLLSIFLNATGDTAQASNFSKLHDSLLSNFQSVFWNDTAGTWFDYDMATRKHRTKFYINSLIPLYTDCIPEGKRSEIANKVFSWLENSTALTYLNGVPTSLVHSEQQWDFPNGWPPLNHMAIMGLYMTKIDKLQDASFSLVKKWLDVNYKVFLSTQKMFEKYDVTNGSCTAGHGGEYNVQTGFGWTNGVVMDLLKTFGNRLKAPETACGAGTLVCRGYFVWIILMLNMIKYIWC